MNLETMGKIWKLKFYEGKTNTNFNGYKLMMKGSQCIWLSVILIDSVFVFL